MSGDAPGRAGSGRACGEGAGRGRWRVLGRTGQAGGEWVLGWFRGKGNGLAEALAWAGLGRARGKESSGPKGVGCVGWVWNQAGLGSFGFWASFPFSSSISFPF